MVLEVFILNHICVICTFNIGRIAYLQANVLSAYVFLARYCCRSCDIRCYATTIRAFGRVEGSMQYLLKASPIIIELMSVYKRLREFERQIIASNKKCRRVYGTMMQLTTNRKQYISVHVMCTDNF